MATVKTKWLASLSDGATAVEGIAPLEEIPGGLSPWRRLRAHLAATGLHITGMRIQVARPGEACRTYNLPTKSVGPTGELWQCLQQQRVPEGYAHFRIVSSVRGSDDSVLAERSYNVVMAVYGSGTGVALIVDESEGTECWVREVAGVEKLVRAHGTL